MYNRKVIFLLGGFISCWVSGAYAASSVRKFNTNTLTPSSNFSASVSNPGTIGSGSISAARKSTIPLRNKMVTPTKTGTGTAVSTTTTATTTPNRLSIIGKNLKGIKNVVSTSGSAISESTAAAISELNQRLDAMQRELNSMATVGDLANYYTKAEVDDFIDNEYNMDEIDDKILNIQTHLADLDASVQNLNVVAQPETISNLQTTVATQESQISQLQGDSTTIYDAATNSRVTVSVVDTFDDSIFNVKNGG